MDKTIAWCLVLATSTPAWTEPLPLPRWLVQLEAVLAAQWAQRPMLGQRLMPTMSSAPKKKKRSRKKLYLSAALTVGAGAVAYWSKARADAAYDRYLRSASVVRQRRELDAAKHFDRVAGVAFVSMEVGLVLSSYLLFFRVFREQ